MGAIERIQYDDEGDVLYLYFKNPQDIEEMRSEEVEDGVLVDREKETGEVVGYTVIDFLGRQDSDHGFEFPPVSTPTV